MAKLEHRFENCLWALRFVVLLGVVFGMLASVVLFVAGSLEILHGVTDFATGQLESNAFLVAAIIGAVDLYLIGVVMLIFSFGLYELFISKIDIGRLNKDITILEITNLDDLKNRVIKVVIMVLVVNFFQKILATEFNEPLEMLYLAVSIFAISFGVYFMHKSR